MDISPPGRDFINQPAEPPPAPSRVASRRRRLDYDNYLPVVALEPQFDAQEKLSKVKGSDLCGICLDPLNDPSKQPLCMVVSCGHVFHCECIRGWISHNIINNAEPDHRCPTCRGRILRLVQNVQVSSFGKSRTKNVSSVNRDILYLQAI
jgi:hypothetical protein